MEADPSANCERPSNWLESPSTPLDTASRRVRSRIEGEPWRAISSALMTSTGAGVSCPASRISVPVTMIAGAPSAASARRSCAAAGLAASTAMRASGDPAAARPPEYMVDVSPPRARCSAAPFRQAGDRLPFHPVCPTGRA
jgi:hypothetical protein